MKIGFEKPNELNSYYFTFLSSDNHKVVYSWNEIFNTLVGNSIYVVTETNGVPLKEMPQRILCISKSDSITGRRYIKCLKEIRVEQVP